MPTAQELRAHGYLPLTPFRHAINDELRDLTPRPERMSGVWSIDYKDLEGLVKELPEAAKENRVLAADDGPANQPWYHESLVSAVSLVYAAQANKSPLSPDEINSLMGIVLGSEV